MTPLSIGQYATLACLLEATAPKPGNVHRGADFEDLSFTDFAVSAALIGPAMEHAVERGVGRTVLDAVQATRDVVATNTNLGMMLLIAPLAAVPRNVRLSAGIADVLTRMTATDCQLVYEAIRVANPGGLGKSDEMDVHQAPPADLIAAMRLAADRDLVARQYTDNFHHVLQWIVPWLGEGRARGWTLIDSIIHAQLQLMSRIPDSLIARKCGLPTAEQASAIAEIVLRAGLPGSEDYNGALADFDFWLRSDGHRRNPGTTADLIAAGLFAALRDGAVSPPYR